MDEAVEGSRIIEERNESYNNGNDIFTRSYTAFMALLKRCFTIFFVIFITLFRMFFLVKNSQNFLPYSLPTPKPEALGFFASLECSSCPFLSRTLL